jgi:arginase family enzyme
MSGSEVYVTDIFNPSNQSSGFGGARVADDFSAARSGDFVLFGCDTEISRRYGRSNCGAAEFIRAITQDSGLCRPDDPSLYEFGITSFPSEYGAMEGIIEYAAQIAQAGAIPALIACDHTASLLNVMGIRQAMVDAPVYVYFDAHFDLGRNCHPKDRFHNGGFVSELLTGGLVRSAINIGGRSPMTRQSLDPVANFSTIPCAQGADAILQQMQPLIGRTIYVSIDADVLDPEIAPNVPCPEPDGMSLSDLALCCQWLGRNCDVIGCDLSEVLPAPTGPEPEIDLLKCLLSLRKISAAQSSKTN